MNMRIVLASSSPRRRELLKQIGWEFEVCVSDADESISARPPEAAVEELSGRKARAAVQKLAEEEGFDAPDRDVLVVGADTIVASGGEILGKPADREDACRMLRMLQGASHSVYTGVTLFLRRAGGNGDLIYTFHEASKVNFYPMSEREIQEYVSTGEPMDKAGAYGIQGLCAAYIRGIEGDYNNVVGLPVGRLCQEVRRLTSYCEDSN